MTAWFPDNYTVTTALALAVRAPSVHNSQPWRWRIGDRSVHLYPDTQRRLSVTDPDERDLVLSCGAALHHARVAFAALGWRTEVHRMPNPAEPDHLAALELHRQEPGSDEIALAAAIPRRRTDRRRYSSWPVPDQYLTTMAEQAAADGAVLKAIRGEPERHHVVRALSEAARVHADDPAYRTELAAWSGRHGSAEGVPAISAPPPEVSGDVPTRAFSDPRLVQPPGATAEGDEAVLLALATASDDRLSRLRAGEATSAVLLTATSLGLACCPLTEPLEVQTTRELLRDRVTDGSAPQMLLRVGWAPINADPLPATPRHPIGDVVRGLTWNAP
ncbi:Acg family FMN-binding oxidoreductase [Prauserella flavalba]|uniref:NAD(P)H nitroreductase n=1 Tax=Prauserella flavalba TaxID=1477506 RepID=A0A318LPQ9_9PSEU|nr:nitroreductase family protein [Prauserella flavalba]PXY36536.1 NAD(P)H nitroreductase [Prauserella flavalba]